MEAKEIALASPSQSISMGLPATEHGVVFAMHDGVPVTLVGDADFARFLLSVSEAARGAVAIPAAKFPLVRAGW